MAPLFGLGEAEKKHPGIRFQKHRSGFFLCYSNACSNAWHAHGKMRMKMALGQRVNDLHCAFIPFSVPSLSVEHGAGWLANETLKVQ